MQSAHIETERARTLSLDSLARQSFDELGRLYRMARCPQTIDAISGLPRGRMLAVRGADKGMVGSFLKGFAGARSFPWGGKTFEGHGKTGHGINRVHLGGRHAIFPFLLSKAPSEVDGEPCVRLDYDLDDNPWAIRKILDEVREVEPGLLLGPAMWKTSGKPVLVLWFALDFSQQARPIGGIDTRARPRGERGDSWDKGEGAVS
jgi:hypothetical protein